MIKPEDFKIGDLVKVSHDCILPKGAICVVAGINPKKILEDKKGTVCLSATNDDYGGPWWTWCCNIEGIPVTPEILRNNDFKEEVEGKYFTRPIKARFGSLLARYLVVERKKYAWAIFIKYYNVTGYALLCHIKYVHELQLVLKIMKFSPKIKV